MKTGSASGLQIAFFTFALLLLVVPLTQWLVGLYPWPPSTRALLEKAMPFAAAAAILFGIPSLRRRCIDYLSVPIPPDARVEVGIVTAARLLLPFALVGGYVAWHRLAHGDAGIAAYVARWGSDEREIARAFDAAFMAQQLLLAGLIAPVLEELVFRGFLYQAWERQWGWLVSMSLTSLLFALYHRVFWSAFLSSIVFVCLYRRTGSLWAPIVAHAAANISLWYPLIGWQVFRRDVYEPGRLASWSFQLLCLAVAAVAIPAYVVMASRPRASAVPFANTQIHGVVPK